MYECYTLLAHSSSSVNDHVYTHTPYPQSSPRSRPGAIDSAARASLGLTRGLFLKSSQRSVKIRSKRAPAIHAKKNYENRQLFLHTFAAESSWSRKTCHQGGDEDHRCCDRYDQDDWTLHQHQLNMEGTVECYKFLPWPLSLSVSLPSPSLSVTALGLLRQLHVGLVWGKWIR